MKAILLAGGTGSRLYPLTRVASKQLQPVYDKPMIYYPLTVLMAAGIRDISLISSPDDLPRFKALLGDGAQWGIQIRYFEQARPEGIAQALVIAEPVIAGGPVVLMLGDNIFSGGDDFHRALAAFRDGATIFAYRVVDPQRYGVVKFDRHGQALSLEEKPERPKSNFAVPGVYIFDHQAIGIAKSLQPSARGEYEITDVNQVYLQRGQLHVHRLTRGFAWLDAGTTTALHEASDYVATLEKRQGVKIGCPEEAALLRQFITADQFDLLLRDMPDCEYRTYLSAVAAEWHRDTSQA